MSQNNQIDKNILYYLPYYFFFPWFYYLYQIIITFIISDDRYDKVANDSYYET